LQEGKPKHYIVRELVQNAWDENITKCSLDFHRKGARTEIVVEDDSPEGFRNLDDAYTLFGPTYKRSDPQKRGRFNLGEKQAFAICDDARIETTKGTVVFDKPNRRRIEKPRRKVGSKVTVHVKMSRAEFQEMKEAVKSYLPQADIEFRVDGVPIPYRKPWKIIEGTLTTEIEDSGAFKRTARKTKIHILKAGAKARLYEMGIPITEIESKYDIDVRQKVPMSVDRETVSQAFLSLLYVKVLNATFDDISPDEVSEPWVREAAAHKKISPEAVKAVIEKRFGPKAVVANPGDKVSNDDALASGYRVVHGSDLSKGEWKNVRAAKALQPSSEVFKHDLAGYEKVEPDENMERVAVLAKKIAKRFLRLDIRVDFASWKGVAAQFGDKTLTFNVGALGKGFFDPPVSASVIDLTIHEIGHAEGMHTEKTYHKCLTRLAGELTMTALEEPGFFNWREP
jgi:hypothetical protein